MCRRFLNSTVSKYRLLNFLRLTRHSSASFYWSEVQVPLVYNQPEDYITVYSDACKEDGGLTAMGMYSNGAVTHAPFPDDLACLHITHLEFLGACSSLILAQQIYGTSRFVLWRGGAWSGVPGVGARCGNGLFSTYKSPKILS